MMEVRDRQFLPFHLFPSSEHLPLSLLKIDPFLLFSLGSDECLIFCLLLRLLFKKALIFRS